MLQAAQLRRLRRAPSSPNRLAAALRIADLTQTQFGDALSLSQSQVSRLTRGDYRDLSLDLSRQIASHFGCSVDDIFPARHAVAS